MKKFCYFFLSLLFLALPILANGIITPELQKELNLKSNEEKIRINIRLSQQYDTDLLYERSRSLSQISGRRSFVTSELKDFSKRTQAPLLSYLNNMERSSQVSEIKSLWIANVVNCYASKAVIEQLATRSDIDRIDYDQYRIVIPLEVEQDMTVKQDNLKTTLAWNVTKVNAHLVWQQGFTGEGVVVAVLDTGVNYNHQDLQPNMWQHPDFPYHGYNFVENNNQTMDGHSHGTHCAGTVAGTGAAGTATGMAPGAQIMALKVLGNDGGGTEFGVWQAIEFSVEYGAHVMSLSLGWNHSWNPDRQTWRTTMNNAMNAGVVAAVAAGNEGEQQGSYPAPSNVRTPGDCPPPWLHPHQTTTGGISAVVCVGSTTNTDAISSFSSRGPSTWQSVLNYGDYPYNPGMGLIRPDIVAPGSNITSTSNTSNTGYTNKSGTSMATPCVAGLMALSLSKNISLTPEDISRLLETTAISMSTTKSNTFGSGRVDAVALLDATPYPGPQYLSHAINDALGNADGFINPGEEIKMGLELENLSDQDYVDVEVRLRSTSAYIQITDSVVVFQNIPALGSFNFVDAFTFVTSDSIPDKYDVEFSIITSMDEESWRTSFEEAAKAPHLKFEELQVLDPQGNNNNRIDPGEDVTLVFNLTNIGQLTSENVTLTIESLQPMVLISQAQQSSDPIDVDASEGFSFDASVHENIPLGSAIIFKATLTHGGYHNVQFFRVKVGEIVEDFESGDFSLFNWNFSGSQPWSLVNEPSEVYQGLYSAKSGVIANNTFSQMYMQYEVMSDDTIAFRRKISSEMGGDFLKFYIDNQLIAQWSGELDWQKFEFPVSGGIRTFRWVYQKNNSGQAGADAAWVDYIQLPASRGITAFAGNDAEICVNGVLLLEGYAGNGTEYFWASSGDGTFSNLNALQTTYVPGQADQQNGLVKISLNVTENQILLATDTMNLILNELPFVFLGNDTTICINHTLVLDAGEGHHGYLWSNGSRERFLTVDSTFASNQQAQISVRVTSVKGCSSIDQILIIFDPCLSVDEQMAEMKPILWPNPSRGGVTLTAQGIKMFEILDIRGAVLYSQNVEQAEASEHQLDVQHLRSGVYFVRVYSNNLSHVLKLIKE